MSPTLLLLWTLLAPSVPWDERGLITITGAADLRTIYSDGADSVKDLALRAKGLGLDSIIINDHLTYEIEYGIFPFQNLAKYKKTLSSLKVNGLENYFQAVKETQKEIPEVIIIPGIEVSPLYWWSGSFLNNTITAHDWEFHLGILGLEDPDVIRNIPAVHNEFTTPPTRERNIRFYILTLALLFSFLCMIRYRRSRWVGLFVLLNLLLVVNYFPANGPEMDIYREPDGVNPSQEVIDYVKDHGGISVWHHMEALDGITTKANIKFHTPAHPEDILKTEGFTGFQGVYEDRITITDPGKQWDKALMEYTKGTREKPIWAFGGLDYHQAQSTPNAPHLRDIKHIYWVEKKSKPEIMKAMRIGRFYSVRQGKDYHLLLDRFSLTGLYSPHEAISGETLPIDDPPTLHVRIGASDQGEKNGTLRVVQNGKVVAIKDFVTPYEDAIALLPPKDATSLSYVRLMIDGKVPDKILTNPIFFGKAKPK